MVDYERVEPAPVHPLAREHMVAMRDRIRLATDVYLPPAGAEGEDVLAGDTVLIRLPYDKSGVYTFIPLVAEYFLRHGYRVVAQDVRGKFRSEGDALLFVNEAADGSDTLDWIIQQPWSNGRVAMWGDSYYGFTQWAAASTGHRALKAIAPRVTGTQLGEPVGVVPGSRQQGVEWGVTYLYPVTHFLGRDTYLWDLDWSRRDFAQQVEDFLGELGTRSLSYDQWAPNAVRLPRFPFGNPFASRSVPALQTIGWWDNCAPLSWADVDALKQHPAWDAHHHLLIEPIDHEAYQLLEADEDRVAERTEEQIRALLPRTLDPTIEFFEVFVRGNGSVTDIPRVRWNLAGTDEYRHGSAWPPQETRDVVRYASEDGRLSAEAGSEARLSWTHDPQDLVPSSVQDAFSYLLELPDEAPIGDRDDVLVFTSPAAEADAVLAGPVRATATVSSTGPVIDLFVRLLDVAPDGTALRIARGQAQLVDAERPGELDIDLGHVGYLLREGHRLRVHVSSSDYPEFLPQRGDGSDPWHSETLLTNEQSLVIGGPAGFAITLPLLEGALP